MLASASLLQPKFSVRFLPDFKQVNPDLRLFVPLQTKLKPPTVDFEPHE
jgi:hypothetical protein